MPGVLLPCRQHGQPQPPGKKARRCGGL